MLFIKLLGNGIYRLVAFILKLEGIETSNWPDRLMDYFY